MLALWKSVDLSADHNYELSYEHQIRRVATTIIKMTWGLVRLRYCLTIGLIVRAIHSKRLGVAGPHSKLHEYECEHCGWACQNQLQLFDLGL